MKIAVQHFARTNIKVIAINVSNSSLCGGHIPLNEAMLHYLLLLMEWNRIADILCGSTLLILRREEVE